MTNKTKQTTLTKEQITKLHNLSKPHTFNNYNDMCKFLEAEPKKGNSRKAHLQMMTQIVEIKKKGHKLKVVKNILNEQEMNALECGLTANSGRDLVYGDKINKLMIHNGQNEFMIDPKFNLLDINSLDVEEFENNKEIKDMMIVTINEKDINGEDISFRVNYITPVMLMKYLGLINDNYKKHMFENKKISQHYHIDPRIVKEFFDKTYNAFTKVIERTFRSMYSQRLMMHQKVTMVVRHNLFHEEAKSNDYKVILDAEKEVLTEMGLKDVAEVILKNKYISFKENVISIIEKKSNIINYYKTYKLIFSSYVTKQERLNNNEFSLIRDELNKIINKQHKQNALKGQSRYEIDFYSDPNLEKGERKAKYMDYKLESSYNNEMNRLIDIFLSEETVSKISF